jgi:hypothetical protein
MIAWKLFEEQNGLPISLVHGMPQFEGGRSRKFLLDELLTREEGTPGFNCFLDLDMLIQYLPRFKVRAPRLNVCAVSIDKFWEQRKSVYVLSPMLYISGIEWAKRMKGSDLL